MSENSNPDDLDWVAAQATCSAAQMFERLRAGVKKDVQRRNGVLSRRDGWRFEFYDDGSLFEVSRSVTSRAAGPGAAVVRFERAGRRIQIVGDEVDVDVTAIVSLDGAGVCRFVVGEAMYSEWELRRMALEHLFFEDTDEGE